MMHHIVCVTVELIICCWVGGGDQVPRGDGCGLSQQCTYVFITRTAEGKAQSAPLASRVARCWGQRGLIGRRGLQVRADDKHESDAEQMTVRRFTQYRYSARRPHGARNSPFRPDHGFIVNHALALLWIPPNLILSLPAATSVPALDPAHLFAHTFTPPLPQGTWASTHI